MMEWRGDESLTGDWLPGLQEVIPPTVNVSYLIVDQKAAIYVLRIRGAAANKCFIFNQDLGRSSWKDVKCMRASTGECHAVEI